MAFKKTLKANEAFQLPDGTFIRNTSNKTISIAVIKEHEFINNNQDSVGVKNENHTGCKAKQLK